MKEEKVNELDQSILIEMSRSWEGSGTQEDPFICKDTSGFPSMPSISKSSIYIRFMNCHFDNLGLNYSSNLTFEDSTFGTLSIYGSSDSNLINCTVSVLILIGAKGFSFQTSKIDEIRNFTSSSNTFTDCSLSEASIKSLRGAPLFDFSKFKRVFLYLTIFFGTLLGISLITWVISGIINIVILLSQAIIFFVLFVLILVSRKIPVDGALSENYIENSIDNNKGEFKNT